MRIGSLKRGEKITQVNEIWEICCGQLSIYDFRRLLWWFILFIVIDSAQYPPHIHFV